MKLDDIEIGLIHEHPANIRRDVDDVDELADSISSQGVLEPLIVTQSTSATDFGYTLLAGHRRLAAARLAGLLVVPCLVRDPMTPAEEIEVMLVENLQRSELTPVEEAAGYQQLLDLGVDVPHIAAKTGRSQSTVRSRLALTRLPEPVLNRVHRGQASLTDAADVADANLDPADVDRVTGALGTSNFRYVLNAARHRAKEIEAARNAGAQIATTREEVDQLLPNAVRLPYGTKPAEGMVLFFPTNRSYSDLWGSEELQAEMEAADNAARAAATEIRKAGLSAEDRERLAQEDAARQARQARAAIAETAHTTRMQFLHSTLGQKKLRPGALAAALRSTVWSILENNNCEDRAFEILGLRTADGRSYPNSEDVQKLGVPAVEALDLEHLALLLAGSYLSDLTGGAIADPDRMWDERELADAVDYFDLMIGLGYDLNDVDQAQLAAVEARLTMLREQLAADEDEK